MKVDPPFRVRVAIYPAVVLPRRGFILPGAEGQWHAAVASNALRARCGNSVARRGTKLRARGSPFMSSSSKRDLDGVAGALAMHLGLYCAVAACFALVFYYLMLPTRLPNPGMIAHNASPRTVNYIEELRSEREAAKRDVSVRDVRVEPEPETTGAATAPAVKAEANEGKKVKSRASQGRTRAVERQQPVETRSYAAEPSFGAYRPMY